MVANKFLRLLICCSALILVTITVCAAQEPRSLKKAWSAYDRCEYQAAIHQFNDILALQPNNVSALLGLGWSLFDCEQYEKAEAAFLKGKKHAPHSPHVLYGLGWVACEMSNFSQAEQLFQKVVDMSPRVSKYQYALGKSLHHQKKNETARIQYEKAIALDAQDPRAYMGLLRLYTEKYLFSEAEEVINEMFDRSIETPEAFLLCGDLFRKKGQYKEAEHYYRKVHKEMPHNQDVFLGLGWVFRDQGNYSAAIEWYTKALAVDVPTSHMYEVLGETCKLKGAYNEAIRWLECAIAIDAHSSFAYERVVESYAALELYEDGRRYFHARIKEDPENELNYHALGWLYEKEGNLQEAVLWEEKALKKNDIFVCPYQRLAQIFMRTGDSKKAESNFLKVVETEPESFYGYYDLAHYYYNNGQYDLAKEYIERALELAYREQDTSLVHMVRGLQGFIKIMHKEYDEALMIFQKLEKSATDRSIAYAGKGFVFFEKQQYAVARENFEKSVAHNGKYSEQAYLGLGWISSQEGDATSAIYYYDKVLALYPKHFLALLGRASELIMLNNFEQAERELNQLMALVPDDEFVLAQLGVLRLNQNKYDEAESLFKRSLSINPHSHSCPYEGLGLVYLRQGKVQEATQALNRSIAIEPHKEFRKYNALAKIHLQKNEVEKAISLLEQSLQNNPNNSEAEELLAQIQDEKHS